MSPDDEGSTGSHGSVSRRGILQAVGISGAAGLAGCLGGGGGQPCRDLRIDLSTGTTDFVPDAFGTTDTDWEVTRPNSTTTQATSIQPVSAWVTSTDANWIDSEGTGGWPTTGDPLGNYVYETEFEVPDTWDDDQCELRIHEWSVDDAATLELDGPGGTTQLDQATAPGHTTMHGPVTQPVGPGQYTLRARVTNNMTVSGLLVHAEVFCDCDPGSGEPCDLSITKEHTGEPVTHGGTAEFEISVCNEGDGECESGPVTVVDDLPAGTSLASHSGNGWDCTESGGTVACEYPQSSTLGSGDCLPALTLTLDVGEPDEVGDLLVNCAELETEGTDGTVDSDCVEVPIESPPGECDLAITKSHSGDLVAPGDTTEFEIEVCNVGDGDCYGLVTVGDSLPSSLTFVSASGPGWTTTNTGGNVVCDHQNGGGLAPGDCLPTLILEVELGSIDEVGDAVRNCARLKYPDVNGLNNQDCALVPVDTEGGGKCDLSILKSHDGETVTEGSSTSFAIDVCNTGDGQCDGPVTVVDNLPAGVTFDAASGTGWSVNTSGGSLVFTHPNAGGLAAGDCLPTLTLDVTVGPIEETGDVISNCAYIKGEDVNPQNDRDCVRVPVDRDDGECDLSIDKRHVGDVAYASGPTTFQIEVCNEGDGLCDGPVTVVDGLPSGVTFDAATGTGWSVNTSGGSLVFTHANAGGLAPGDCLPVLNLNVSLGPIEETGEEITNCAAIKGEDADPDNNEDCVTVPVEPGKGECDLAVTKTHDGEVVTEGGTATFEIEVCNVGDGRCTGPVKVFDGLPAGVTFDAASGTGWTVTQSANSLTFEHPNSGSLAPGNCLPTLTLEVSVGSMAETGDAITNCARLGTTDANSGNNYDCVTVPIQSTGGKCDLSIDKRHLGGDLVEAGTTTTFEIDVCNAGDGTCDDPVTVVDTLPSGLTFVSGSGTGWTVTNSGGTLTCQHSNSGGLAPGSCLPTLSLAVQVGSIDETGDQFTNCAVIEGSDAYAGNDRDCVTVGVTQPAGTCDLSIDKRHPSGDQVEAGTTTTFELDVCNAGDGSCDDPVTVVDTLPPGLTFVSGSGTGWTVTNSGGTLTCQHSNAGGLAPGSCLPTLTLTVQVGSIDVVGDQFTNCAAIEGASDRNDRDCVTVGVTQPTGGCDALSIEKLVGDQFNYGQQETYDITVCNPSGVACDGRIVVTDDLPDGMTFVSVSGSGWSASVSGGVVTATHPNTGGLAPGDCLPRLTVTVDVAPASQFPGGSDGVQNCADLVVGGTVVAQDCVSHVIHNA